MDEQNTVPAGTRTFHVNLGPNAQLFMRGRVFRRLNRISIDGGRAGGRQQIDFGPRAFHDNTAPFPEIDLRHAQTLNIHGHAFQGTLAMTDVRQLSRLCFVCFGPSCLSMLHRYVVVSITECNSNCSASRIDRYMYVSLMTSDPTSHR